MSTEHLHLDGFESIEQQKRTPSKRMEFFLVDDIGLDCQFVPVEQIVRMQPVFELVAADVHRTSAFRWVRVHRTAKKNSIRKDGVLFWWTI